MKIKKGNSVYVDINIVYADEYETPSELQVHHKSDDGYSDFTSFPNI